MATTLPQELWSKVISFLVRDVSEPRTTKHWFDLHQDDLCSMMRVNSTFHDLTAPHLYHKAVVPCITAFMRNIETIEVGGNKVEVKIIKSGIKTKKDMLAYVREIHFVYYPTVFEPTYRKLFGGSSEEEAGWKHIGMSQKQLLKLENKHVFNRAAQVAGGVTLRNDILAAGNDFNPFPRLEIITVGANGDEMWEKREKKLKGPADLAGQMMRQMLNQSKSMLLAILSVSQPQHVCIHTMYGLSSPPTDGMYKPKSPNRLKSFNVHVDEMPVEIDTLEPHWPTIICGTINRWHYRFPFTRFDISREGEEVAWSLEILVDELNETYKHFKENKTFEGGEPIDLKDTELEIWGFGNCEPIGHRIRGKLGPNETRENAVDDAAHAAACDAAYEKCADEDYATLERLEKEFNARLCDAWKGKVTFGLNEFIDNCDGCGDLDHSNGVWSQQRVITDF